MSKQLFEDGTTITLNETDVIECVAVGYQETPEGEKHSFTYTFRDKAELDAERLAEAERQAEVEAAEKAQADLAPSE